ncbi:MAG TPA: MBL fold metallo-hydrolase [Chthonomonadaceae bacterium]|nr:MBL fold metallo-hydrolase [Chthonomonadaceae bacterium]
MSTEKLYLRRNLVMEPLVDQWYAWPHLISPATTAMNIVERHIKIMESYVRGPKIHAAAVKNPAMRGGPFIDYPTERVEEVKALIEQTRCERADMIELAQSIVALDELLRNEALGYSLEPLYPKVPEPLRGYVELVYDLNNNPSFRVIEPLLYRSKYYDPSKQSLMLSTILNDDRPFVLSTPRFEAENDVHLKIPFAHEGIDTLFRMRSEPRAFGEIKEMLGLEDRYDGRFREFFTTEAPPAYKRYDGPGVRWRYFGHACILVETRDICMLLDPVLSYTYDSAISRYTYDDLPDEIDYVLITHNHQDHLLFETLLQIRSRVKNIIVPRNGGGALQDPSLRMVLQYTGFPNVIEVEDLDTMKIEGGEITFLPFLGEHSDLNVRTKTAFAVRLNGHQLLFAADSCNIEPRLYEHLYPIVGDVDVLFLGMECDGAPLTWLYGPLLTRPLNRGMDQSRRLAGSNFERARSIVETLHCKEAYVYAMGQEPWLNYIMSIKYTEESNPIIASNKLIAWCGENGIMAERLFGEKEILIT